MSYAGKIEDLIAERDELRNALAAVSDALDYLHGLTPEQAGKLCKDAERYRFLRNDFSVMGANIDGQHSWAYRRNFSLRGPTLDAAIDTAMGGPPVLGAA